MNEVIVSICIPTYKNITSFERCLTSILFQTYNNYEIIITDDTPSNEIYDFISSYNFKGKPYKYIKNKVRLGSPANWNECIKFSRGKFIKILHHDDWFTYNDSLQIFVNTLENKPEASIGFVSSKNINTEQNLIVNINSPSVNIITKIENTPSILICGNFIGSPSATIFRKNNIQYFDENLIWLVDIDAYINILKTYNSVLSFDKTDAISIGVSNSQITRECEYNIQINIYEFFYLLYKYKDGIKVNNEIIASIINYLYLFKLNSISDIRRYYIGPLPIFLSYIFLIKKLFFKKFTHRIFNNKLIIHFFFNKNLSKFL
jgi:glycosyltransferase involved in cell wall biosynthesis